jgi:putative transposase
VAQSFFATIKGEMLDPDDYETRAEATAAIDDYIEGFHNPRRRHSSIGYVSPIEFEMMFVAEQMAA